MCCSLTTRFASLGWRTVLLVLWRREERNPPPPAAVLMSQVVSWTSFLVICTVMSKPQLMAALSRVEKAAAEQFQRARCAHGAARQLHARHAVCPCLPAYPQLQGHRVRLLEHIDTPCLEMHVLWSAATVHACSGAPRAFPARGGCIAAQTIPASCARQQHAVQRPAGLVGLIGSSCCTPHVQPCNARRPAPRPPPPASSAPTHACSLSWLPMIGIGRWM